jgi:hypothetical protein
MNWPALRAAWETRDRRYANNRWRVDLFTAEIIRMYRAGEARRLRDEREVREALAIVEEWMP